MKYARIRKMIIGWAQTVQHLPSKSQTLSSNLSVTKIKKDDYHLFLSYVESEKKKVTGGVRGGGGMKSRRRLSVE
jgi:hypothetical protein